MDVRVAVLAALALLVLPTGILAGPPTLHVSLALAKGEQTASGRSEGPNPRSASVATPAPNWTETYTLSSPSGRFGQSMAYDTGDGYAVLFGGCSAWDSSQACTHLDGDTWIFANGTWSLLEASAYGSGTEGSVCYQYSDGRNTSATTSCPSPRVWASMAYDASDRYVLLFAGCLDSGVDGGCASAFNDTWTFAAGHWSLLATPHAPWPRASATMSYDSSDGYVVLFGGTNTGGGGLSSMLDDTWTFHAGIWTQDTTSTQTPYGRSEAMMSDDPTDGYVVLFGGNEYPRTDDGNDTWEFHSGQWTADLSSAENPPGEVAANMDYYPPGGEVVLSGGLVGTSIAPSEIDDTWLFSGGQWRFDANVSGANNGMSHWWSAEAFDSRVDSLVLFVGNGYGVYFENLTMEFGVSLIVSGPSPTITDAGVQIDVSVAAYASTGTLSYDWEGLPPGCPDLNASVIPCTPASPGGWPVTLYVNDTEGRHDLKHALIGVNPDMVNFPPSSIVSPTSQEVGGEVTFNASFWGGTGPWTYAWALSDGEKSTRSYWTQAFLSVGLLTVDRWVNDSLGQSLYAQVDLVIGPYTGPALSEVAVAPPYDVLGVGSVVALAATAECSGAQCPGGISFTWSVTNSLGALSNDTNPQVDFEAGNAVGIDTVFVNATLAGRTVQSAPVTLTIEATAPVLLSVVVAPASATLSPEEEQSFQATPNCSGGPCPWGIFFSWSLRGQNGTLSSVTGMSVVYRAGSQAGQDELNVTASLNAARVQSTSVNITIAAPSPASASSGFLGLSGDTGYFLVGGIVAAAAVVAAVVALPRKRKPAPPPSAPPIGPVGEGAPPAPPSPD